MEYKNNNLDELVNDNLSIILTELTNDNLSILMAVIASIGLYIAFQQWRTGERKRKHDLFDERVKIYEELSQVYTEKVGWLKSNLLLGHIYILGFGKSKKEKGKYFKSENYEHNKNHLDTHLKKIKNGYYRSLNDCYREEWNPDIITTYITNNKLKYYFSTSLQKKLYKRYKILMTLWEKMFILGLNDKETKYYYNFLLYESDIKYLFNKYLHIEQDWGGEFWQLTNNLFYGLLVFVTLPFKFIKNLVVKLCRKIRICSYTPTKIQNIFDFIAELLCKDKHKYSFFCSVRESLKNTEKSL